MDTTSVMLRHKKFPLAIIFRDPPENWNSIVKERLLEEIKEKGFDNFVIVETDEGSEES